LYLPEVREALMRADLVVPSLDAGDAALFEYVNRPHPDVVFERMIEGLVTFGKRTRVVCGWKCAGFRRHGYGLGSQKNRGLD
jgi:wyosine [tRNA(Phe)-imidazoG37] synthetase (radical SAM superfamily)